MTSVKDVAQLAGVSLMTVSRALNTPEKLSPETLLRVRRAIDELQFVPSLSARKMRGDKPFVFSNQKVGQGLDEIIAFIERHGMLSAA